MKDKTLDFTPAPGIILVDPIDKTRKSSVMSTVDPIDDPHTGEVIAIGDDKPYENDPSVYQKPSCKVGDVILYSIAGIEKTRLKYGDDLRHQFVIVPFGRVLGIRGDKDAIH